MSHQIELPPAVLAALNELAAVGNDQLGQLTETQIRQQFRSSRDLAVALNRLPVIPPVSRQGTPAPL